jgi:hypothetical protein
VSACSGVTVACLQNRLRTRRLGEVIDHVRTVFLVVLVRLDQAVRVLWHEPARCPAPILSVSGNRISTVATRAVAPGPGILPGSRCGHRCSQQSPSRRSRPSMQRPKPERRSFSIGGRSELYPRQPEARIMLQKLTGAKCGSLSASTSALTLPKVVPGLCLLPS